MSVAGKKLLILGGGSASYDMVKMAQSMGIYTIVTDNSPVPGVAKQIADEMAMISTADIDALVAFVRERNVDGVFCGPSEFNLRNVIQVCETVGLPCYTDMATWDRCANKNVMKSYCRKYGVDTPAEYAVSEDSSEEVLAAVEYPVIVKPVDGSSSTGVCVCQNAKALRRACAQARASSASGKIVVEQYIENGGEIVSIRYLIRGEKMVPYLIMDDYIVDPVHRTSLISGFLHAPSKYSAYYMANMDMAVRQMLRGMGLRDGCVFMQALPYKGRLYLMDMGYRLSGGMIFKVTDPLMGVNDMQMMLRTALGQPMYTDEEVQKINLLSNPKCAGQLTVPLNVGVIGRVEDLDACKKMLGVIDVLEYYRVGDEIPQTVIGTLGQLFCRITLVADSTEEMVDLADRIQKTLRVYDTEGNRMNVIQTDFSRLEKGN